MRLDKRLLLIFFILAIIVFFASLYLFPEWRGSICSLVFSVLIGVVGFLANFRQAFERKDDVPSNKKGEIESLSHERTIIEHSKIKGDVVANSSGDITKITTQINQTLNFPQANPAFHGSIPPCPSLMIGRADDLKTMKNLLIDSKKNSRTQAVIRGWPGVGKTTFVSALAHDPEIEDFFSDGVLWTSLGQHPNILSQLVTWGRVLSSQDFIAVKTVEEGQAVLRGLLRDKRMLIIIDDVWEVESAVAFNVGGKDCSTLFTTRLDEVANALASTAKNNYRLKVLKDEEALELLNELAPQVVKQYSNECLVLLHDLEGLPLALQVAGRLLNAEANYGFNVVDLLEELRDGVKLLEAIAPADRIDLVNETTPTIAVLLQKSLERLDEFSQKCFAYLGVFAPKPATFDEEALSSIWKLEDPKPTIKKLVDRGLLEYVPQLDRYQMHMLLVMLAKSMLTE